MSIYTVSLHEWPDVLGCVPSTQFLSAHAVAEWLEVVVAAVVVVIVTAYVVLLLLPLAAYFKNSKEQHSFSALQML